MLRSLHVKLKGNISTTIKRLYARLPSVDDVKDPLKILKHDVSDGRLENILPCPRECDVLIIGGSLVGSSVAYFSKEHQNKLNVVIIEPDQSYSNASALLSAGGMRQQFSCRENIEMSQFGFEFLRRANQLLAVEGEPPPDVQFNHAGYLIMADKDGADEMLQNHQLQLECGTINMLLTADMLKRKYPWINTDGIEVASVGLQGEGWFDPAALLSGLRGKNKSMDIPYINGKVIGFEHGTTDISREAEARKRLDMTLVELPNGDVQPIRSSVIVNAAGPWAGEVALKAGIGDASFDLSCAVPLPVEPRKRFVFNFHCPDGPGLDCGLVVDCSQQSVYFRREGLGNNYICGLCPPPELEHDISNLDDVEHDYFQDQIWPKLAHRVPAFEGLRQKGGWAGYYEYNYIDHNLVIGNHPFFKNFVFANGSTGHGLQHCPAIGRAISELISYHEFRTVDLNAFTFERFINEEVDNSALAEKNVY